MQRQIKSFTYKNVRYFLPDSPPAYHDDSKPWGDEQSQHLIGAPEPRSNRQEHTPDETSTVEYVQEVPESA